MKPKRKINIDSWDDVVFEAGMCPDLEADIHINLNGMDQHFLNVADKHGVVDEMFSERFFDEDQDGDWL